ncbi:MAG: hypothetical protein JWP27_1457 [Flaviaesturariibacter sp.]|nr:hypothetical protein [Flaviaesturariibacter sp.]
MCDKVQFDTKGEARDTAAGMSADRKQSMEAYLCDECGSWHLRTAGKRPEWSRRRTPARFRNDKYKNRYHPENLKPPPHKINLKKRK